jgi:hypothetical protein
MYSVRGKIREIKPVEQISEKFKKQIVLVEQSTKYDAIIPLEFVNQKVDDVVPLLEVGDSQNFNVNIHGREWKDRYFVSIRCYGISNEDTLVAEGNEQGQKENLPF